ncbi:ParB/RepB/Spo0J family partition protein [Oscillochloris sp. ZM17-4]|uniref:ParB/RepB/Spo0J family partition protein n=1 Tax=Oscillochloris sp. ZM17-4 TaxID=2866714 RepID=UPI001C73308F|nr:ParB/RepB/Spo0J family partition protein [Oscillochloris sp. ZM17-4]MBX0330500.1 ParB/RepB/Spo0J family partition protein [Oscillochloris sp. ZM17-4]
MPPRTSDRLRALQERAASLAAPATTPDTASIDTGQAVAAAGAHFGALADLGQRTIQRIATESIAPDLRPDRRQARLLPLPEDLVIDGASVPAYADLVAELRDLGRSLKERQIQPIVAYAGTSSDYPTARYLILIGHRRWTAARLLGLDTLDTIVVDEPAPADRVLIQYAENEAREEFSDMERAWSLLQMKQALGDAPWEVVESRMQLSRARRQQLLRLVAFQPEQQQQIARLRLQETQIRTLHSALRANEITAAQVDSVMRRLDTIAAERSVAAQQHESDEGSAGASPRRAGIDGPTVSRLVARVRRASDEPAHTPAPRWLPALRQQVTDTARGLARARPRMEGLGAEEMAALRSDLDQLLTEMEAFAAALTPPETGA